MEIIFLTLQEVKIINFTQIDQYGGLCGMRDEKLLDSAINYPQATFNGRYLHPDIYHMASAYMYAIIKNHPFLDGNKRTGFITTIFFLAYNNITLIADHNELFMLAIAIAESKMNES
ncbi:MAG TPA: type II toxin-antitoxin system death-on-curing family toxin [Candidatus Babeliales bacterium]|jgi:death-on-curing protein|nr:type II toxin-antitoxin system death-on-curing family toxin [Candidatus Babeliales bacterium]